MATIHLMMATVLSLYSRYKIQYLSLAWIMGIFGVLCCMAIPLLPLFSFQRIGYLHPLMLLGLVVTSFLQGIYPLSITMPGYLQMGRMWRYASPAILLIILYIVNLLAGNMPQIIHSYAELEQWLFSIDMIFRLAGLGLSIYYVANVVRLPHQIAKSASIPRYVKGYVSALCTSLIVYVVATAVFNAMLLLAYFISFCVLNMYLFYRTLETMAIHLPKPEMIQVKEAPTEEVIEKADCEDFNEANLRRFERVEFFMQHNSDVWKDSSFGRDRLCSETGINRHILLQCLRSQGYNNSHDYISSYRINALKQGVAQGTIVSVADTLGVGFGTSKTARGCFERMEGQNLDDYLKQHAAKRVKVEP